MEGITWQKPLPWVGDVAGVSGYDVKVELGHGLAGGGAAVQAEVELAIQLGITVLVPIALDWDLWTCADRACDWQVIVALGLARG